MNNYVRFDHPLVMQGLQVVREHPSGIYRAELAALLEVTLQKASRILYCLEYMGLVRLEKQVWFADEPNEEAIEAGKQKMLESTKRRNAKRNATKRKVRAEAKTQKKEVTKTPPRNWNDLFKGQAPAPTKFVVSAPNSVWQLQYFV